MSDHRGYVKYLLMQDPRGQARSIMATRRAYQRDGEEALPPELPEPIPFAESTPAMPASDVDVSLEALNAIARRLRDDADGEALENDINQALDCATGEAHGRLLRFMVFLRNRRALLKLQDEHPFWLAMIQALSEIWLADGARLSMLRNDLLGRRLTLLSSEGASKLVDALRQQAPELAEMEDELLRQLSGSRNNRPSPHRIAQAGSSPLPNLDSNERSWSVDDSKAGGFRWYHFVAIYFVLKFLYFMFRAAAG